MLQELSLLILNRSFIACPIIILALFLRFFLRSAPKIYSYALWSVVLFRLLSPVVAETSVGVLPGDYQPFSSQILEDQAPDLLSDLPADSLLDSPEPSHNLEDHQAMSQEASPENGQENMQKTSQITEQIPTNHLQTGYFVGSLIWLTGVVTLLLYSTVAMWRLKRTLAFSLPYEENVFFVDHISIPFVFGLWKPKIYLPSHISPQELPFIIAHEKHHIKRFDHLTRAVAFLALTLHWFNPLVWLAYFLSEQDMEQSCDEAVLRQENTSPAEYATSLLKFSSPERLVSPLAFSESDTKERVKNIMKFKKSTAYVSIIPGVLLLGFFALFGSDQASGTESAFPEPGPAISESSPDNSQNQSVSTENSSNPSENSQNTTESPSNPSGNSGNTSQSTNPTLTAEEAKAIALNHAGLTADQVVFLQCNLDYDDGILEYDVEFYSNSMEYDYEINTTTGEIRSFDHDMEFQRPNTGNTGNNSNNSGSSTATITADQAQTIALNHAGLTASEVSRLKCELDFDDGRWEYEIQWNVGRIEYEYTIHGGTGRILDFEKDYD